MAVPDFQSLMLPSLQALYGETETQLAEVRARVAASENLSAEDLREIVPSGRQTVFTNLRQLGRNPHGTSRSGRTGTPRRVPIN